MAASSNIFTTVSIAIFLAVMGGGCVDSNDEVMTVKQVSLIRLPAGIQPTALPDDGGKGLTACARVKQKGVNGEVVCQKMEITGTKARLTIPNLKADTNYIISIEFSFSSGVYGDVVLATVEKSITTAAGSNSLGLEKDAYQYPDDDNDGWDNFKELKRGTSPRVVDKITRTSLIAAGDMDCPYGGTLVETGIDENTSGVLDDNEVDGSESICKDGLNSVGGVGWQGAKVIENGNTGDAWNVRVVLDNSGYAMAVWQKHDGSRYNIWASRFVPGTGWGTAMLIETSDAGDAVSPQVALDDSGNVLAVWQQNDGTRENIWANRFVPGTGWGTATLIETNDAGDAVSPQVALNGSGKAVTVWRQNDGQGGEDIWANRFDPDTGWGPAELIETDNLGDGWSPQVAIDRNGSAVAVWAHWDNGLLRIWANRFVADTGWGVAGHIGADVVEPADYPQVVMDDSGNGIVVWQQTSGTRNDIWANRFTPEAGWGTAERIEKDDAGSASNPQVAMDGSGNAVVVWQQGDGVRENIRANRFVPGTGWDTAVFIETGDAGDAVSPQVAVDSSGNAIVVWQQSDGTHENIWANRFVPAMGLGTAELIETDDAGPALYPRIAVNSSGNAMAVWHQFDSDRYGTRANRFLVE